MSPHRAVTAFFRLSAITGILAVGIAGSLAGGLAGCTRSGDDGTARLQAQPKAGAGSTTATTGDKSSAPAQVVFLTEGDHEVHVNVEQARTRRQIQRGLMYREHLPPDGGMVFLFRRPKVQSFWMKNTLIPLDMIFVSPEMEVVGVVENAEPQTTVSRTVGVPSQYVIEVNGGFTARNGIVAGTKVRFDNIPPITAADGPY